MAGKPQRFLVGDDHTVALVLLDLVTDIAPRAMRHNSRNRHAVAPKGIVGPLLGLEFLHMLRLARSTPLLAVLQRNVSALVGQNVELLSGPPLWGHDYPAIAPGQTAQLFAYVVPSDAGLGLQSSRNLEKFRCGLSTSAQKLFPRRGLKLPGDFALRSLL